MCIRDSSETCRQHCYEHPIALFTKEMITIAFAYQCGWRRCSFSDGSKRMTECRSYRPNADTTGTFWRCTCRWSVSGFLCLRDAHVAIGSSRGTYLQCSFPVFFSRDPDRGFDEARLPFATWLKPTLSADESQRALNLRRRKMSRL